MGGRLCYIYDSSKNHNTAVPCQRFPLTQDFTGSPHSFPILSLSCFHCSLTSGPVAALHRFWKLTEKREKQNTDASGPCSLDRPAIKWKKKISKTSKFFPQQHASLRVACKNLTTKSVSNSFRSSQISVGSKGLSFGGQFSPCP